MGDSALPRIASAITLLIFTMYTVFPVIKGIWGVQFSSIHIFLKKEKFAIIVTKQMLYGKGCLQIHWKLITSFLKYIEKFSLMSEMKYL